MRADLRGIWRGAAFIVLLAVAAGTAANARLIGRFLRGEFRQSFTTPVEYPRIRFITIREAEDLFATGGAAFLDSRSRREFGTGHVPGAKSLPLEEHRQGVKPEAAGVPLERTLVVYCEGGDCQASIGLARLLHDAGFLDIRVLTGGWAEWQAAGLPESKTDD
ncbi:MAG: rhodanese-like domain-containing protein [Candidatus Aminicenantes bacterium]|nr:rhodanese-like domain-containing protein [Candidatus Aminicenantes bacterium]